MPELKVDTSEDSVKLGCNRLVNRSKNPAIMVQSLKVDVAGCRTHQVVVLLQAESGPDSLGLGEQRTILSDQAMSSENQIGGRFGWPGAGIDIRRDAFSGLRSNQPFAICRFADRFIAGR